MIDHQTEINDQVKVDGAGVDPEDTKWLRLASRAYQDSTDYYQSGVFDEWVKNVCHFRNQHAPDSKFLQDHYKQRSKIFRPKVRSAARSTEAALAAALFTNDDLLSCKGQDPNNKLQDEAAKLHQALLQHRLETTVPWYLTCLGAFQDTSVYGICITRCDWDFNVGRNTTIVPAVDHLGQPVFDDDGFMLGEEQVEEQLLSDTPAIAHIMPENFRVDPSADWRKPVQTSPYIIEMIPMYAQDVMDNMTDGKAGWRQYVLGELITHGIDSLHQGKTVTDARDGRNKQDRQNVNVGNQFSTIWIHFNIIREPGGIDMAYYTVGTGLMLTDPKPLHEINRLGRDMYTIGYSMVEAHKTVPDSRVALARPLTEAINEVTNQRFDNVRLVLNKRHLVRRNANIDLANLMRSVPGGGVLVDDLEKDVKVIETTDVTSSSYAEQDRLSVEADELMGNFSQGSVQSNRKLNETVGGMNLMSSTANQVQEYDIRTFVETWVEPVLRCLVKLEALFETDETILALAAGRAKINTQIDDTLMMQDLVIKVNVGLGSSNPTQRIQKLLEPIKIVGELPDIAQKVDWDEVGKEVFAMAGHGDGSRFMLTPEKLQERAKQQSEQGPQDPRIMVAQINAQLKQVDQELAQSKLEQDGILRQLEIETNKELKMAELALQRDIKLTEVYEKLGIERESMQMKAQLEAARDKTNRDIAALRSQSDYLKTQLQATNLSKGYDTF